MPVRALSRRGVLGAGAAFGLAGQAAAGPDLPALRADPRLRGPSPVPLAEQGIPSVVAEPYFKVLDGPTPLEGVAFDRAGDLLLCDVGGERVLRVTSGRVVSVVAELRGRGPGGLAVTPAGRILVAGAGDMQRGSIVAMDADGGAQAELVSQAAGLVPNDLVLDRGGGGVFFTDFKGTAFAGTGGVFHLAQDGRMGRVLDGMALPNGIACGPDGGTLYVAEHGRNRLVRVRLDGQARPAFLGVDILHNFTGPKPDTVRVDVEGNILVAMNGQGRVLVLAPGGTPIGQVLLPGRDDGRNLKVTSMALRPGSDELFVVASDGDRGGGGWIHRARSLAAALP